MSMSYNDDEIDMQAGADLEFGTSLSLDDDFGADDTDSDTLGAVPALDDEDDSPMEESY